MDAEARQHGPTGEGIRRRRRNRAGANGIIGTDAVAKARPDGYTLAFVLATHAINPLLYRSLPYDTDRDLIPISLLA
jgi:tripartite-type tricarboxylate transporter receptor subunit TctC